MPEPVCENQNVSGSFYVAHLVSLRSGLCVPLVFLPHSFEDHRLCVRGMRQQQKSLEHSASALFLAACSSPERAYFAVALPSPFFRGVAHFRVRGDFRASRAAISVRYCASCRLAVLLYLRAGLSSEALFVHEGCKPALAPSAGQSLSPLLVVASQSMAEDARIAILIASLYRSRLRASTESS